MEIGFFLTVNKSLNWPSVQKQTLSIKFYKDYAKLIFDIAYVYVEPKIFLRFIKKKMYTTLSNILPNISSAEVKYVTNGH